MYSYYNRYYGTEEIPKKKRFRDYLRKKDKPRKGRDRRSA
jgi:hypothetical protein